MPVLESRDVCVCVHLSASLWGNYNSPSYLTRMHIQKIFPMQTSHSPQSFWVRLREAWARSRPSYACVSVSACVRMWPNTCVQLTQRYSFLYDSQLRGLGPLVGHPAPRNVQCATLLESPSYPHTLTTSSGFNLLLWGKGEEWSSTKKECFKFHSWYKNTEEWERVEELMSSLSDHPPTPNRWWVWGDGGCKRNEKKATKKWGTILLICALLV